MITVDTPKIRRASAAMNHALLRLNVREALLALQASAASIIVHSYRPEECEEAAKEFSKMVEDTTRHLMQSIEKRRSQ